MGDREAFLKMMGISDEDITHPDSKPPSTLKANRTGGSIGTGAGTGTRLPSSLGAASSTQNRSNASTTRRTAGAGKPLEDMDITPSPYHTASEALAGAKRDAVRMAQREEEGYARSGGSGRGGGYGDYSDSQALYTKQRSPSAAHRGSSSPPPPPVSGATRPSAILSAFGNSSSKAREAAAEAAFLRANDPMGQKGKAESISSGESADKYKEKGNDAFENGDFLAAIQHYSRGIDLLENSNRMEAKLRSGGVSSAALDFHSISGNSANKMILSALYSNRSAAYLQASKLLESVDTAYDHSLFDADQAVSLRPEWFKGYARQGDAYFKMNKYKQAVESYAMALSLEPGNLKIADSLKEARERAKAGSREEWKARRARRQQSSNPNDSFQNTASSLNLQASLRSNNPQTSSNHFNSTDNAISSPKQRSYGGENAKGLWESFKSEVELTNHTPTGDNYRQQQLEKFRQRGTASLDSTLRRSNTNSRGGSDEDDVYGGGRGINANPFKSLPPISKLSSGNIAKTSLSSESIPTEYSTAAASAYQQQLLENYRRKKGG
eukprot:gene1395-818_t